MLIRLTQIGNSHRLEICATERGGIEYNNSMVAFRYMMLLGWILVPAPVWAAEAAAVFADPEPILRLETGGPTAYVTSLAFSPDGTRLYVGGMDKTVRVWERKTETRKFELTDVAFRVPIGPGLDGAVNAIAISMDGKHLAVGGNGVVRGAAGFREPGIVLPSVGGMSPEMRLDQGTIYVFNTENQTVRTLRGHRGPVIGLTFCENDSSLLVSAGREWDAISDQSTGTVRIWNLETSESRNTLEGLPNPELRPGLAAHREGDEVQVALAMGDGQLRLWTAPPEGNGKLSTVESGLARSNMAVQWEDNHSRLITAAMRGRNGEIQSWPVNSGALTRPASRLALRAPRGIPYLLPRAMNLIKDKESGDELAALIVRSPSENGVSDFRLRVLNLATKRIVARAFLWRGSGATPAMASSPDDRVLAIAGDDRHRVFLFETPFARQPRAVQVIQGMGRTIRQIAFVEDRDKNLALQIGKDHVMDFQAGRLRKSLEGWNRIGPTLNIERIKSSGPENIQFRVTDRTKQKRRVTVSVESGQQLTAFTILPPSGAADSPILALALMDMRAGPLLHLHDAVTGELFRQLKGHAEPIRDLAGSPDGRLLASTSDDQTISIWSLQDVHFVLGERGQINGLAIETDSEEGVLRIAAYADPNKAEPGDEVGGLVLENRKLQRFATAREFYETISQRKPGEMVTIRIDGKGDVALPVGQGVDERKPLMSLFLGEDDGTGSPAGQSSQSLWLAWSPLGPYEYSDPKVEQFLGWHFNTGRAAQPTSFAFADQYRKQYLRPGLMKHLIEEGELSRAMESLEKERLAATRLPMPEITAWVDELGPGANVDAEGHWLVRSGKGRVLVSIAGLTDPERIASVVFEHGTRNIQVPSGNSDSGRELSIPIEWKPGVQECRVVVTTRETSPQVAARSFTVRYQPPAPRIVYSGPQVINTDKDSFVLKAKVSVGDLGQSVAVRVAHADNEWATKPKVVAPGSWQLEEPIQSLKEGPNLIEVLAVNLVALEGFEELETARLAVTVNYSPKKEIPPPLIALQTVRYGESLDESKPIIAGQPIVVSEDRIALVGKIQASTNLSEAGYILGDGKVAVSLKGLKPETDTKLEFSEEISLSPGPQEIRFIAKTAESTPGTATVQIDYRPRLPRLVVESPPSDGVFTEGRDSSTITVQGRFIGDGSDRPFLATLKVRGSSPQVLSPIDGRFRVAAELLPGENVLRFRLRNQWGASQSYRHSVRFLRPPKIIGLQSPGEKQLVTDSPATIVAHVETPDELPIIEEETRLTLNGLPVDSKAITISELDAGQSWAVKASNIFLNPGSNLLELVVANSDGKCLAPGQWQIQYEPPRAPEKAVVEILQPAGDMTVTSAGVSVEFRVRSVSRIYRIELVHNNIRYPVELPTRAARESVQMVSSRDLELRPGSNSIRIVAVNEGGTTEARRSVSLAQPPSRLALLEPPPHDLANGVLQMAKTGNVILKGTFHVAEPRPATADSGNPNLRMFVNGFQQRPIEMKPTGSGKYTWESGIVLTQPTGNRIEMEVPGVAQEAGIRREFTIDCEAPQNPKTLHVLIVGIGEPDSEQLIGAVQTSLETRKDLHNLAFDRIARPIVLSNYVSRGQIFTQLRSLQEIVRQSNDVLIVYWLGQEKTTPEGSFLLTSESQFDPDLTRSAIRREALWASLDRTLGARVVMLDLTEEVEHLTNGVRPRAVWPVDSRIGVLQYSWQGSKTAPPDSRLPSAWDQALGNSRHQQISLSDIARAAARFSEPFTRSTDPRLTIEPFLPAGLRSLIIARKKEP